VGHQAASLPEINGRREEKNRARIKQQKQGKNKKKTNPTPTIENKPLPYHISYTDRNSLRKEKREYHKKNNMQ